MTVDSYPPTTIAGLAKEIDHASADISHKTNDIMRSLEKISSTFEYPDDRPCKEDFKTGLPSINDILLSALQTLQDINISIRHISNFVNLNILDNAIEPEGQTERSTTKKIKLKHKGIKLPTRHSVDNDDYED